MWSFVVVHEAVPAELIYALTQALLDHADEVRAAYPTAAAMTRANAVANTFLPFHVPPGGRALIPREGGAGAARADTVEARMRPMPRRGWSPCGASKIALESLAGFDVVLAPFSARSLAEQSSEVLIA